MFVDLGGNISQSKTDKNFVIDFHVLFLNLFAIKFLLPFLFKHALENRENAGMNLRSLCSNPIHRFYSVYKKQLNPFKFKLAIAYCSNLTALADCFELMIRKNKRSCAHWKNFGN